MRERLVKSRLNVKKNLVQLVSYEYIKAYFEILFETLGRISTVQSVDVRCTQAKIYSNLNYKITKRSNDRNLCLNFRSIRSPMVSLGIAYLNHCVYHIKGLH